MLTEVGWRVNVPVVSLLFSDSFMAVTFKATSEPAGITTRPDLSFTSLAIFAITVSPTLFLCDRISAVVAAVRLVPAANPAGVVGADAVGAEGDGVVAVGAEVLGAAAGRVVRAGVRVAGAGAAAVGRSFSSALVSTGASCRSRLRLSAAAVSPLSPRPQAAMAARVSAAIMVLDIYPSLDVTCSGSTAQ